VSIGHTLFGFRGRLNRAHWWLYGFGLYVASAAVTAVLNAGLAPPGTILDGSLTAPGQWIGLGVAAALLWPTTALAIKRRHDRGQAGWLTAGLLAAFSVLNALPLLYFVLGVIAFEHADGFMGVGALILGLGGLAVALLVVLGVLPGTAGDNRYGPQPGPAKTP
jgi:uncharacterized membrane protein YhaH (DUF805 family)